MLAVICPIRAIRPIIPADSYAFDGTDGTDETYESHRDLTRVPLVP